MVGAWPSDETGSRSSKTTSRPTAALSFPKRCGRTWAWKSSPAELNSRDNCREYRLIFASLGVLPRNSATSSVPRLGPREEKRHVQFETSGGGADRDRRESVGPAGAVHHQ